MTIPILNHDQAVENLTAKTNSYWPQYFAFYSSWFGGIIKNPGPFLLVPMDDHIVHRGDGVFEAIKAKDRNIYQLQAHLERLFESAQKISLSHSYSLSNLTEIIIETLKVAEQSDCLIRVFLSRGPGAFSANPYDSVGAQLYVVITKLNVVPEMKVLHGVSVGRSLIPVKEGSMAQIKSCNYLPNVLMKKESVDRKLDFTVSFDAENFLAESATENMLIVDQTGALFHPQLDNILKGTTMSRAMEIAKAIGIKTCVRKISEQDIEQAVEVMMAGTTIDILPVTSYEGKPIADGKIGKITLKLRALLQDDMQHGISY